ncbi:UDP-N-acetylenolpyruvoylglucosamine reductase [Cryobacterium sp. MLB-32]|uniref:UDP-N-acetylmuramate dehydrogenase n=1 Tax=Cryobacterium sp. MLB-32 TaxID=1529318 RepID=UPI0004E77C2C|nr:UDP-N-acetylmuramate dehydrogenase [Cryobacterium sp. MLB-32]KFF58909.1 UDP-N-acetylenolpyruvoylglucosamine reductase [Cryobacterium sp. MLB-32]
MILPVPLSELTTMRVGGPPSAMVAPATEQDLVNESLVVWAMDEEWMLLGGGSNTVASDEGFEGIVIHVVTRGIERLAADGSDAVRLRVQAGEPWDELVAYTVAHGWAGIEALSGIPGSCGATPVQNIGAYGQELSDSLSAIDFLDYETGEVRRMEAAELHLDYRTSVLKQGLRGVVLAIELDLRDTGGDSGVAVSEPVAYGQLASALGVDIGARVGLETVRSTVLGLRAAKGMVLDPNDPDTFSAGSFFTNPIVTEAFARTLPAAAPRWVLVPELPDRVIPLDEYAGVGPMPGVDDVRPVKLSAAWLIEHSGVRKGFRLPGSRAAISSKHTLALTNTGGASAAEIAELARYVLGRVQAEFGVNLQPEPVLVGLEL